MNDAPKHFTVADNHDHVLAPGIKASQTIFESQSKPFTENWMEMEMVASIYIYLIYIDRVLYANISIFG